MSICLGECRLLRSFACTLAGPGERVFMETMRRMQEAVLPRLTGAHKAQAAPKVVLWFVVDGRRAQSDGGAWRSSSASQGPRTMR